MSDIVERLREVQRLRGDTFSSYEVVGMVGQAADEIERQRASLLEIRQQCAVGESHTWIDRVARRALEGKE